ncbi:MAG: hypothetical protein AAGI11_18670 [Pseudomonadota bacterium]
MTNFKMPAEREFGWELKPVSSTEFGIHERENGQFCVVLNHSLLRGLSSEMIHWWFLNFPNLLVELVDIAGYEGKKVPAYLLWHPSDHLSASLSGDLGVGNTAKAGAFIAIKEAMQYLRYGWKYPVNNKLRIFYCESDGWAMGKDLPLFGKVMSLRIHYRDVYQKGELIGVQYHYEIVIGVGGNDPVSRLINKRIKSHFSPEFFEAWHTHNVIEVGTFENFLPSLYEQRDTPGQVKYAKSMNGADSYQHSTRAFDTRLFEERMAGYQGAKSAHDYQAIYSETFLE